MNGKFTRTVKWIVLLVLGSFSFLVSAHPGHGGPGIMQHDVEHLMWLLCGVLVCASVFYIKKEKI